MDNSSPIPVQHSSNLSTPPLPPLSPPSPQSPKFPFSPIIGGLILLVIGITGGIFIGKNLSSASSSLPASYISSLSPTSYLLPTNPPSPTLDPTVNWKTYTSIEGKFSFKYPPSYEIDDKATNSIDLIKYREDKKARITPLQPKLPTTYSEDDYLIGIQISFDPIDSNKSVQEYVDEQIAGLFEVSNKTNIKVDGVEGIRYLWDQPGRNDSGENVVFIHQRKDILIRKFPQITDLQNEFDQILSSFKFLD